MSTDWAEALGPEAFVERPSQVKVIQTHISYVFVLDDVVYKIKKPVDFGFLDFTTLEKRKHFCERELDLNRRLCPEVYLQVVPVVKTPEGFRVGAQEGETVEYAIRMRRMPEEGMMQRLLQEGTLTKAHIDLIVDALVEFYKNAATGKGVNEYGSIETIRFNTEENFQQTASFVGTAISRHRYDFIVHYTRQFIDTHKDLFKRRITEGRIREGHGDLYSANICFEGLQKVYIFDCIEFNERFRCGDLASEVAFLAMDLDFHNREDLSRYFVERFIETSGDRDLMEVLDFYKCYRAYVRAKIGCFTSCSEELPEPARQKALNEARRYFNLAYGYAGGRPVVVVVFGLTGTGKTTLARALQKQTLGEYISTDLVRKALAGVPPEEKHFEPFEKGIYSPEFTEKTYRAMLQKAKEAIAQGRDVVLDGTYRGRAYRREVLEMAKAHGAKCLFVQCEAPEQEIKRRIEDRLKRQGEVSDARWQTYLKMRETFEPPEELSSEQLVVTDTTRAEEQILRDVLLRL